MMAMDAYSDYVGDLAAGASAGELRAADSEHREWLADTDEHDQHPDNCGCPVAVHDERQAWRAVRGER